MPRWSWWALLSSCALGLWACEEEEEPNYYLPVGENREGGSAGSNTGGGGDGDAGEDADADAGEDADDDAGAQPDPTQLGAGSFVYLRQGPAQTELVAVISGGSPQTLGALTDDAGAQVVVAPDDLTLNADGDGLLYAVGSKLYASALDGGEVVLRLDGAGLGLSTLKSPRVTAAGGSVFFLAGAQTPEGFLGTRLYRLADGADAPTTIQPSLASCEGFEGLALRSSTVGFTQRVRCADPGDEGLVQVQLVSAELTPKVMKVLGDPTAQLQAFGLRPGEDQLWVVGRGLFDLDADGEPEESPGPNEVLYRLPFSAAPTEAAPLNLPGDGSRVRSLSTARGPGLLMDLEAPQGDGLYRYDPAAQDFAPIERGDDLSNPVGR